ncbi:MAG: EamA family transporter, partial [Planktomarina sp.]
IATGLLGLGFLIAKGGSQIPLNIGDFYGFASGVTWAFGGALIKRHGEVPMPTLTFFQFLFAAVFALILGGLSGLAPVPSAQLLVQVLPTAIATSFIVILPTMFIIFWAQKFLFPGRVGLLMMTEVIVAILTASIFLPEEAMNTLEWIGAALIIGACLVEILTPGKAKAA